MSKKPSLLGGIGFFGLLGIVFITLKLTGFIDWSWWLVTAPLWGGVVVAAQALVIAMLVAATTGSRRR